ncbi:hypothetical protein LTR36_003116 [Oleoguttula mirabilis]|uniref:Uncharacterized protein n=1 Tax=Oleoguttula mirabilis TaxID=1507867 RepID=A0AAV9JX14_9PEZI|nr:hypothetical protein LTR36_003116 [Oleoguttula mirabilis]
MAFSDPLYLWIYEQCPCPICTRLYATWRASTPGVDWKFESRSESRILGDVQTSLSGALKELHRLHKPELYAQEEEDAGADHDLRRCEHRGIPCPHDVAHCRIECTWFECVAFRKTAEVLGEIVWWEKDKCAEAVAEAKKAVWEAWQTVHRGHTDDMFRGHSVSDDAKSFGMRRSLLLGNAAELREADWAEDADLGLVCGFSVMDGMTTGSECSGEDCSRLKKAVFYLNSLSWWGADEGSRAISTAQKTLWAARKILHRRHRADLYDEDGRANWVLQPGITGPQGTLCDQVTRLEEYPIVSGESTAQSVDVREESGVRAYDPYADHVGKFIVCDHCMSHGLTCNEASVCNQCIFRQLGCVHRSCPHSAPSRATCSNPRCHYVHDDYQPQTDGEARWILLPGRMPDYLVRGRAPDLSEEDAEEEGVCMRNGVLDEVQAGLMRRIDELCDEGTRYHFISAHCDCNLERDNRAWLS